jgi:hypothetical protein
MTSTTPPQLLDMADRMRRCGGFDAQEGRRMLRLCEDAYLRGEIDFDSITTTYKHLMIHMGAVTPMTRARFYVCPECEATLD